MPQGLDPATHSRRTSSWAHIQKRVETIIGGGQEKRGHNRKYWFRIARVPEKFDAIAKRRGWAPFKAMQAKALLTARMLAYYTDHQVKAVQLSYQKEGQTLTPAQENKLWQHIFEGAVYRYRSDPINLPFTAIKEFDRRAEQEKFVDLKRMPERDEIAHLMKHIPDLIAPPRRILAERAKQYNKRPKQIRAIIERLLPLNSAEMTGNLKGEIEHIIGKNISPIEKAHKLCFAASIYADAKEMQPQAQKSTWNYYYSEAMFGVYNNIAEGYPEVIDAIQEMK